MRKTAIFLMILCIRFVYAQEQMLSLGAGGGATLLNPHTEQEGVGQTPMPVGTVDFGYTYLQHVNRDLAFGLKIGAEIGGGLGAVSGKLTQKFTNTDYLGNTMQYTTYADFAHRQKTLFAQVPLMLTMRSAGLTVSLGAKACLPLKSSSIQQLKNASISAYYDLTGVTITDRLITGLVPDEEKEKSFAGIMTELTVKASAEIGYEWSFVTQSAIGLKIFADVSVWNNYKNDPLGGHFIEVAPIRDRNNPVPTVKVNNATELYCSSMLPIEVGLKFYYAFVWNNYGANQIILNRGGRRIRIRFR